MAVFPFEKYSEEYGHWCKLLHTAQILLLCYCYQSCLFMAFVHSRYTVLSPENFQPSLPPLPSFPDSLILSTLPCLVARAAVCSPWVCFRVDQEPAVNHFSFKQKKEKNKGVITSAISNLPLQWCQHYYKSLNTLLFFLIKVKF